MSAEPNFALRLSQFDVELPGIALSVHTVEFRYTAHRWGRSTWTEHQVVRKTRTCSTSPPQEARWLNST